MAGSGFQDGIFRCERIAEHTFRYQRLFFSLLFALCVFARSVGHVGGIGTCCGIVEIDTLFYTNRRQEQETNNKIQAQDTSLHEAIFEQASSIFQEIGKASRLCVAPSVLALVLVVFSPQLSLREHHTGRNKAGERQRHQASGREARRPYDPCRARPSRHPSSPISY